MNTIQSLCAATAALSLLGCFGGDGLDNTFATEDGQRGSTLLRIDDPDGGASKYRFQIFYMRNGDAPEDAVAAPTEFEPPNEGWSTYADETYEVDYLQNVPAGEDEAVLSYKFWPSAGYIYAWRAFALGVEDSSWTDLEYFSTHGGCIFEDPTSVASLEHLSSECPYPEGSDATPPEAPSLSLSVTQLENGIVEFELASGEAVWGEYDIDWIPENSAEVANGSAFADDDEAWRNYYTYESSRDGLFHSFSPTADGLYRITLAKIVDGDEYTHELDGVSVYIGNGMPGCRVAEESGAVSHEDAGENSCSELVEEAE